MKASDLPAERELLPTPIPVLNGILGGGIPMGVITECSGMFSSGKSTLALQIVAQAQKLGKNCYYADAERTFSTNYAKLLGVNCRELEYDKQDTGEQLLDNLEGWARKNKNGVIVIDAVGALLPREEAEGGAEKRSIGLQARMMGSFCRRIIPILDGRSHALLILNHNFVDMNTMKVKTSGGEKLSYAKSIWILLKGTYGKQAKRSPDGTKEIIYIQAEVKKNKIAPTEGAKCDLELAKGLGFATEPIIVAPKKRGRPKKNFPHTKE